MGSVRAPSLSDPVLFEEEKARSLSTDLGVDGGTIPDSEEGSDNGEFDVIVPDSEDGNNDENFDVPESITKSASSAVDEDILIPDHGGVEDITVPDNNPMSEEKWRNPDALQFQPWFQNIPPTWHDPSTKAFVAIWFPGFFI
ncbi:hypothetical protein DM860_012267 [Cuscuta australis]|uniref:Uncharacterized protein n=1 Tax=Cuscuta australis TaxID=267555 RepID=A0A328E6V7_9ASTE|nr:hypothetical protein DM860_012267 [Cuscuta australis]